MKILFSKLLQAHGKFITFSVAFLMISSVLAQTSPSGKVWYGIKYLHISIDTSTITNQRFLKEVLREDNKAQRLLKPDKNFYVLLFKGNNYWFKPIPQMKLDGESKIDLFLYSLIPEAIRRNGVIYEPTTPKEINGKAYYLRWDFFMPTLKTEIKDDYKTILGYRCQKAVVHFYRDGKENLNNLAIVWFTKDIPVGDGPGFYAGLPGLVLAVKHSGRYLYARKIKLKKHVNLNLPPDDQFVTKKELNNRVYGH